MAKKKLFDENGNEVKGKLKKPFYKKVWFWVLIVLVIGAAGMGAEEDSANPEENNTSTESAEVVESESSEAEVTETESSEESSEESIEESNEPEVSREFENALKSAQNYIDLMPFSEKGLYNQLTSEYGDQYPEDAAQYAIENVEVDYNEEALEAAKNYQETMPMSDSALFDQLTSEHGDQFTPEQAQYAVDNLE